MLKILKSLPLKQLFDRYLGWWKQKTFKQQLILGGVLLVAAILPISLIAIKQPFVPLFNGKSLEKEESVRIRDYLVENQIAFEEKKEGQFLVSSKILSHIRGQLAKRGIPKTPTKGLELFDEPTWIKGEKELQVLERRALKGQIERELLAFESIQSAFIQFEISPSGKEDSFSKASVLLSLKPQKTLSEEEVLAICTHVAGGLKGLLPQQVAIADSKGTIYHELGSSFPEKSPNPQKTKVSFISAELQQLLAVRTLAPFFISIIEEDGQWNVWIATGQISEQKATELKKLVAGFFTHLGYVSQVQIYAENSPQVLKQVGFENVPWGGILFTALFLLTAGVSTFFLIKKYPRKYLKPKKTDKSDEEILQMMTKVDLRVLANSLVQEEPEAIAYLLSYLEPDRAETILFSLPDTLQEAVLKHLSEMEKEQA